MPQSHSFDPFRNTVTPEPVPEPVPKKKSFNLLKILLPILGLSILVVIAVIFLPIGTIFGLGSGDSGGDGSSTVDSTVVSPDVGTIVHPSEEHIVTDDETLIQYVDNTVLAFIHSDLTDEEKQDVAATVNGTIIGELYECVTMLQIQVEVSTLSELKELIEVLEEHELVYSAAYDFVMEVSTSDTEEEEVELEDISDLIELGLIWSPNYNPIYAQKLNNVCKEIKDDLSIVWWKDVIQLTEVWDEFGDYFTDEAIYVGVVDDNLLPFYSAISGRVSFGTEYTELWNDTTDSSHGTTVCSIIVGKGGVVNTDQVTCYFDSAFHESETVDTYSEIAEALAAQASMGCKVINNSYGVTYPSDEDDLKSFKKEVEEFAQEIAKLSCDIISNYGDILFVQAAGNGIDNYGDVGVDAVYNGLWGGITDSDSIESICSRFGMTYQELKDHILVVTAVNSSLSYTGNNYGKTVDIAAPHKSTSFAAPEVTGVATLVWAADPDLTTAEVKQILTNSYASLGWSNEYSGKVPVVNAYMSVYNTLYSYYSVAVVDEAGSPVSGITLQAWDAEGEMLDEQTTEADGIVCLAANRMEIDCVVVLDANNEILETIEVPEDAKTYDYYSTEMCSVRDTEELTPHDLGTVVVENEVILLNKLSELIDLYGTADADQTGTQTDWLASNDWLECTGLVSATILDFDSDDLVEMLVCTAQVDKHDHTVIMMDMWEVESGKAVQAASMEYVPYFYTGHSGSDSCYAISSDGSSEFTLAVSAVQTGGNCYLFCEMCEYWVVFAEGFSAEYWILQYEDGAFRYIGALSTLGWSALANLYYGVIFDQGEYVDAALYFSTSILTDALALYTSFAEAATAYFAQYGVLIQSDASEGTLSSILSSNNDSVPVFQCVNELVSYEHSFLTVNAEYSFTLTRGNALLQRTASSED